MTLLALLAVASAHRHEVLPSPPHVKIVVGKPPGWTGPVTAASDGHTLWRARHVDRFTLQHELGHVFDEETLTNANRRYFMRLMRLKGPWTQAYEAVLGQRQGGARRQQTYDQRPGGHHEHHRS